MYNSSNIIPYSNAEVLILFSYFVTFQGCSVFCSYKLCPRTHPDHHTRPKSLKFHFRRRPRRSRLFKTAKEHILKNVMFPYLTFLFSVDHRLSVRLSLPSRRIIERFEKKTCVFVARNISKFLMNFSVLSSLSSCKCMSGDPASLLLSPLRYLSDMSCNRLRFLPICSKKLKVQ